MSQFPQTQRRSWELEYGTDDRTVFNFFNAVYAWMAVGWRSRRPWRGLSRNPSSLMTSDVRPLQSVPLLGLLRSRSGHWRGHLELARPRRRRSFCSTRADGGAYLPIFRDLSAGHIVAAFAMTGGVFAGMSIYGFVTKRDLTSMGSFLVMCVW